MKTPLFSTLLVWTVASTCTTQAADEWSRFLGPNGRPVSDVSTIPSEFTAADYNWIVKVPGHGHSSPVLWGKDLFLTTATSKTERKVLCYDSETGKQKWEWATTFSEYHVHPQYNGFASSTPCLDEKHVYIFWTTGGETEALALTHDGKLAWREKLGVFETDHGDGTSPILVDGVLFLYWESASAKKMFQTALNPADGKALWRRELDWPTDRGELKASFGTPGIFKNSKGQTEVIVSSMPFGVQSIDAKTGKENWNYNQKPGSRTVSTPVMQDGIIFCTWGSGNGAKDHIALISAADSKSGKVEVAWKLSSNKGLPYVPTPLAFNGKFYMWADNGVLQCLNAKTGAVVFGPERIGGDFFSNPVVAGNRIFCGAKAGGELIVVEAGDTFKVLARNNIDAPMYATPAIANGKLFIRTYESLISVGR